MLQQNLTILSPEQQARFEYLDSIVIAGRSATLATLTAAHEIKTFKLYEAKGFESFEEYFVARGFSQRHARRLGQYDAVLGELPEAMQKCIGSQAALRELSKFPESLRLPLVNELSDNGKKPVTKAAIKNHSPKPPPRKSKTGPPPRNNKLAPAAKPKPKVKAIKDSTGIEVPPEILPLWNRGPEATEILMHISVVKCALEKARDKKDILFAEVSFNSAIASLEQAYADCKRLKPYAVCPACSGVLAKDCLSCKGRGFVSQFYWETCVPQETKKMRASK